MKSNMREEANGLGPDSSTSRTFTRRAAMSVRTSVSAGTSKWSWSTSRYVSSTIGKVL